jgi:5-methylcytosine-specific restriction endonuclease McrA
MAKNETNKRWRERNSDWLEKNKEQKKSYNKEYYHTHREYYHEKKKQRRSNPELWKHDKDLSNERQKTSINRRLKKARNAAKSRGLSWSLTDDIALAIMAKECTYCGKHSTEGKWGGIDRDCNNKGYEEQNCVPCCWECNKAKGILNGEQFIALCKRVAKYQQSD